MAGRQSRRWRFRALVTAGAVLLVAAVVWVWPPRAASRPGDTTHVLTGIVSPDRREPALRPLTEPPITPLTSLDAAGEPPPVSTSLPVTAMLPPATGPASTQPAAVEDPVQARNDYQAGLDAWQAGDLLAARTLLNRALRGGLAPEHTERAREALADVARRTLFTRASITGDPLVDYYVVQREENLQKIARQYKVCEDLLAEINALSSKHFIREGQRLKVLRGPFHATVDKSDHLMHIYLGDVYVATYRVALGVNGTTPTGRWKVVNRQENPSWVDPRTGQRWHANDPQNPLGEYWIGLEGVEGDALRQVGYGIHGTIEPETIGQDVSLGCVRLGPKDIAEVYKLLVPGESFVTITD